jgi:hypothetical protein
VVCYEDRSSGAPVRLHSMDPAARRCTVASTEDDLTMARDDNESYDEWLIQAEDVPIGNHEIALALSTGCFGLVIGFLAGYAVRASISRHRHRQNYMR